MGRVERAAQSGIAGNGCIARTTPSSGELGNPPAELVDDDYRLTFAAEIFHMVALHALAKLKTKAIIAHGRRCRKEEGLSLNGLPRGWLAEGRDRASRR